MQDLLTMALIQNPFALERHEDDDTGVAYFVTQRRADGSVVRIGGVCEAFPGTILSTPHVTRLDCGIPFPAGASPYWKKEESFLSAFARIMREFALHN